jgi:lipopolysaccharide export LptBFGC system permease protein LptF
MPSPTTRQLLRRLAAAFAIAFAAVTGLMLFNYARKRLWPQGAHGGATGSPVEGLLLAVPFTASMTIPMSVFLAVLWVFARLDVEGALEAAQEERDGLRRLLIPVLGAAALLAAFSFCLNMEIVPRANARLQVVLTGAEQAKNDRTMTLGELQAVVRTARAQAGPRAPARAAQYEIEIQKKLAISAASVVMALAGVAIALLVPGGGGWIVFPMYMVVSLVYYVGLIAGEAMGDRLIVSPFAAMWTANIVILIPSLFTIGQRLWLHRTRGAAASLR